MAKKTTYRVVDGVKIQDIQVYIDPINPTSPNPQNLNGHLRNYGFERPTEGGYYDINKGQYVRGPWTGWEINNDLFYTTIELDRADLHAGYVTVGCIDMTNRHCYYLGLQDLMAAIKEYGVVDNRITGRFYFRRGGKVYLTPVTKD